MPTQEVSHWITLSISLINKTDLSEEFVLFTNKAWLDPGDSSTFGEWLPLILGGTKIGTGSDREMILPEAGSIRIDNSIGSFGVDRKFSDLFERYEIVDQGIIAYYGTSEIDGLKMETPTGIYFAKVLDWSHDIDQGQPVIDIRFDSKKIPKRVITKIITPDNFPNAPLSSIGKHLPIVIGQDAQVKPIIITDDTNLHSPEFAYATTLNNEHPVSGISKYYASTQSGNYAEVESAASTESVLYGNAFVTGKSNAAYPTNTNVAKVFTVTTPYIATSVYLAVYGSGGSGESVTVEIRADDANQNTDPNNAPGTILGKAVYEVEPNVGEYQLEMPLDRPVVLETGKTYYFVSYYSNTSGAGTINMYYDSINTETTYVTTTGGIWRPITGSARANKWYWQVKGVVLSDTTSDITTVGNDGLGASYFTATQKTFSKMAPINRINFIVSVNGLKDDSSGSITGSANSQITTVHHAIELMAQEWDGNSWEPVVDILAKWDFDEFSSTYSATNTIAGTTDGETTFEQWLRQVCRNSATKIVLLNDGSVAPYSWGTTLTSQATFTQENSKIIRFEQLDTSYVLNKATIAYDRQLVYFDSLISASQGISQDYTQILNINSDTSGEYELLIGNSVDIYGARELAEIYFNWINTSASATRIARYYLTNFNTPPQYIEIEVPHADYNTLKIMDVVTVINPSLPNYYGGIPNAKLPHYLGEEVDPLAGFNLCEAQTYRAQIERKTITFNDDMAPTLSFECRLLTNSNDPT